MPAHLRAMGVAAECAVVARRTTAQKHLTVTFSQVRGCAVGARRTTAQAAEQSTSAGCAARPTPRGRRTPARTGFGTLWSGGAFAPPATLADAAAAAPGSRAAGAVCWPGALDAFGVWAGHPGGCPDMPRCRSGRQPYQAAVPTLVPCTTEHCGTHPGSTSSGGSPVTAPVSGDVLPHLPSKQVPTWPASSDQRTTASPRLGWRATHVPLPPTEAPHRPDTSTTAGSATTAALRHHQKEKR